MRGVRGVSALVFIRSQVGWGGDGVQGVVASVDRPTCQSVSPSGVGFASWWRNGQRNGRRRTAPLLGAVAFRSSPSAAREALAAFAYLRLGQCLDWWLDSIAR